MTKVPWNRNNDGLFLKENECLVSGSLDMPRLGKDLEVSSGRCVVKTKAGHGKSS